MTDVPLAAPPGRTLLWLLDVDAALRDPDDPRFRVPPHRRALLALLSHQPDTLVAIVGGRGVADLAEAVGVGEPVIYIGYHGLEIRGQGLDSVHPDARASRGLLARIARSLAAVTDALPGVRLERHPLALTLHVGRASEADADRAEEALSRVVQSHRSDHRIRCVRRADAFELLPIVGAGELDVYHRLAAELEQRQGRPVWTICIADDVRGAGWFEAVSDAGVSVAVGPRPSRASCSVQAPADVDDLLRQAVADACGSL